MKKIMKTLRKQTRRKVKIENVGGIFRNFSCPSCNHLLSWTVIGGIPFNSYNYCPNCGQRLDWRNCNIKQ